MNRVGGGGGGGKGWGEWLKRQIRSCSGLVLTLLPQCQVVWFPSPGLVPGLVDCFKWPPNEVLALSSPHFSVCVCVCVCEREREREREESVMREGMDGEKV